MIDIGNIDSGVALVLCDSAMPDMPIIYCSEPFENLTGYSSAEILGHNCRFLQHPPEGYCGDERARVCNELSRREVKERFARGEEARVRFWNFTKDGRMFVNVLTTIPITWEEGLGQEKRYIVGFQADEGRIISG
jgi:PAS domain S-box-containing protein